MSATVDTAKLDALGLAQKRERVAKKEMGQQDFLHLMTTQLQNQDPFKPMESGDFLAQIAQFSTVDGIGKLQESFATLSGSLQSNQALQAAGLINREVLVPSNAGVFFGGENGEMLGALELDNGADAVTLLIKDNAGQTIRTINMGEEKAGRVNFAWDGKNDKGEMMAPGTYKFEAVATVQGKKIGVETLASAPVQSVSLGKSQSDMNLNLVGLGERKFSTVRDIR